MKHESILKNIGRFVMLTPEQQEAFCSLITVVHVKKRQFILREGDVCKYEYYVNSGCFRTYFTDNKGIEHNMYFAIEDWQISDLYSRTQMAPTYCNIVALEDSELLQINHYELEKFMEEVPALERFFRISYEQALVNQHLNNLQLLHMTAEKRYRNFVSRHPKMANRIPQKHIATFLGLTPEFFNTVHAKVARQKGKPDRL